MGDAPSEGRGLRALRRASWPEERAEEALEALARASGLLERSDPEGHLRLGPRKRAGSWAERAGAVARSLGLELEPVSASHGELEALLRGCGPALLALPAERGGPGFLCVVRASRRRVALLGPDLRVHRLALKTLVERLLAPLRDRAARHVDPWLEGAALPRRRRERARRFLVEERLRRTESTGCHLLRLPPGRGLLPQARAAGLLRWLGLFLATHVLSYALLLVSWWLLGRGALAGRLAPGWLLAWGLVLLTRMVPRTLGVRARSRLAVGAGALLKRRLLQGALRLSPDAIRRQGVGQLLGRVVESEAVEALALDGGLLGVAAAVELAMAGWVLSRGAGGAAHGALLLAWLALALLLGRRLLRERLRWTGTRLALTHDLVERLVGHRTRRAQEPRDRRHQEEDDVTDRYLDDSARMDAARLRLLAILPRGWLLLGIAGLAPALVAGAASPARLAVGLGGVLAAGQAFAKLGEGLQQVAGAAIAWRQTRELHAAAARPEEEGLPGLEPASPGRNGVRESTPAGTGRLQVAGVHYTYPDRRRAALRDVTVEIARGDRVLLEGPSGGGKSTLAAVLSGLRAPDSGLILLDGLDRPTLGDRRWRRRVVAVPQLHENHVLTETLAFNLLMGRRWPPERRDLDLAETVCRELGLGELLDRMPAGLQQLVGETGWRLSHGERSRLFLARALLQGGELLILDETFGGLDPDTRSRALGCVLDRARTLLVIAHP